MRPYQLGLQCTATASLQGVRLAQKCPGCDKKQSDGDVPVMLELCEMPSTPSLPLLPALLWSEVVAPDRVLSMDQIELVDIQTVCKQMIYA